MSFDVASRVELEEWQRRLADHRVEHSPIVGTQFGAVLVFRDPDHIQLELSYRNGELRRPYPCEIPLGHHWVLEHAQSFDLDAHDVAGAEPARRVEPHAHAGRRAGGHHVAGLEGETVVRYSIISPQVKMRSAVVASCRSSPLTHVRRPATRGRPLRRG